MPHVFDMVRAEASLKDLPALIEDYGIIEEIARIL
jgi:hypothetical protein